MSSFIREKDFTHSIQDEDHGCRAAGEGIEAIGKQNIRRHGVAQMSQTDKDSIALSLDSMSLETSKVHMVIILITILKWGQLRSSKSR